MRISPKTLIFFGNGESRRDFDIDSVRHVGLLIGFNWAYKDYNFDVICSGDADVSKNIKSNWGGDWIRRDHPTLRDNVYWNDHGNLICILPGLSHGLGWNTGRMAVWSAIKRWSPDRIYLIGFDMDNSNLYVDISGQPRPPHYEKGWNRIFVGQEVVRVGDRDPMTDKLTCKHMTYEEFEQHVQAEYPTTPEGQEVP